ncbi:hypothetical protein MSPP1_003545 [Malassezia sp. CBS 17886]|nr:hypothetical protein MSPP1_003545 [Malassezia sp. CBS 17886]
MRPPPASPLPVPPPAAPPTRARAPPSAAAFQGARVRLLVLASFVALAAACAPAWWLLTRIVRLPLPVADVAAWEDRGLCPVRALFPVRVNVGAAVDVDDTRALCDLMHTRLTEASRGAPAADGSFPDDLCMDWAVDTVYGMEARCSTRRAAAPVRPPIAFSVRSVSACDAYATPQDICVAPGRVSLDALTDRVVAKLAPLIGVRAADLRAPRVEDARVVQYARDVRLVFSLLHEDASEGGSVHGWDLTTELDRVVANGSLARAPAALRPLCRLLDAAAPVHVFSVESQVQWYAPLAFSVGMGGDAGGDGNGEGGTPGMRGAHGLDGRDESGALVCGGEDAGPADVGGPIADPSDTDPASCASPRPPVAPEHFLSMDNLRVFINAAQWGLESYGTGRAFGADLGVRAGGAVDRDASVAEAQTLHFVLYVPSSRHRPLRVRSPATGDVVANPAWLVPQWGGVVVWNRDGATDAPGATLTLAELREPLHLFAEQLTALLGLDSDRVSSNDDALALAVDGLQWRRTTGNARAAVETLASIVRLVGKIPNLGVGPAVRDHFTAALARLDELARERGVRGGGDGDAEREEHRHHNSPPPDSASVPPLQRALALAAQAQTLASEAFFHPSMLAMLYFPDEHKYAVYTPLFGPLIVPLLVALLRELRAWRSRHRAARVAGKSVAPGSPAAHEVREDHERPSSPSVHRSAI